MPTTGMTSSKNKLSALKKQLDGIADQSGASKLSHAIGDLLSAISYDDKILIHSSLNYLLEALRLTAKDLVERELKNTESMKRSLREAWHEHIDGLVCENFEELRKVVESIIDDRLAMITSFRDQGIKQLEELGYHVDNANQLEASILDLQTWKQEIFRDWPSPNKVPSPLNREALAQVRAALSRGKKGMTKEDIIALSKEAAERTGPGG
jgi:hypothetical protein